MQPLSPGEPTLNLHQSLDFALPSVFRAREPQPSQWAAKMERERQRRERDAALASHPAFPELMAAGQQDHNWVCWLLRPDPNGHTPLIKAAMAAEPACCAILLGHIDPNARTVHGDTALMLAAERGCPACCAALIDATDIAIVNADGESALDMARDKECKLLILQSHARREKSALARSVEMALGSSDGSKRL